jgi:hypothetical protein
LDATVLNSALVVGIAPVSKGDTDETT